MEIMVTHIPVGMNFFSCQSIYSETNFSEHASILSDHDHYWVPVLVTCHYTVIRAMLLPTELDVRM